MTVRSMRAAAQRGEGNLSSQAGSEVGIIAGMAPLAPIPSGALALAREVYLGRRRRERFLAADLFGEPTWDILLDLFIAAGEGRRVPTTSACIGANVQPTTALRWLRILEARGLVEREDDGHDGRRTFVCLTARGATAMIELMSHWYSVISAVSQPFRALEDEHQAGACPISGHGLPRIETGL